jgi:hypothetical protein
MQAALAGGFFIFRMAMGATIELSLDDGRGARRSMSMGAMKLLAV